MSNHFDQSSQTGAHLLAAVIHAHWAKRGHEVKVQVVQANCSTHRRGLPLNCHGAVWGVRSDLFNGLPRGSQLHLINASEQPPLSADRSRVLASVPGHDNPARESP